MYMTWVYRQGKPPGVFELGQVAFSLLMIIITSQFVVQVEQSVGCVCLSVCVSGSFQRNDLQLLDTVGQVKNLSLKPVCMPSRSFRVLGQAASYERKHVCPSQF